MGFPADFKSCLFRMSSVKSLMLDYGLPGLAMVGAGLLTFMLTGGPEEFPSGEPADESEAQSDDYDYANTDANDESEESLVISGNVATPKWADELSTSNAKLVEEVRLLREANQAQMELQKQQYAELIHSRAKLCTSCRSDLSTLEAATGDGISTTESDSPSSAEDSTAVVEKIWTVEDWLHQLRSAVWCMAAQSSASEGDSKIVASMECADASAESLLSSAQQYLTSSDTISAVSDTSTTTVTSAVAPQAAVMASRDAGLAPACELLVMYINNILRNPSIPRYRRIATTNSSYMKSLLPMEVHAIQLLAAVGFVKKAESTYFEYAWHSLPAAGDATTSTGASSSISGSKVAERVPGSAEVATRLLQTAVALLTALKTSKKALAELLVQQITSTNASPVSDTDGSATATGTVASSAGPATHVDAAVSKQASTVSLPMGPVAPLVSGGDDGLIAVMEVPEDESLQVGGTAQDDSVDFMKILKKAQESKWKAT